MEIKVIQDLNALGHSVLYFEDTGRYYIVSSFIPSNKSDHIYINELIGRDITEKVKSFDVNFSSTYTIETMINNTTEINLKFPDGWKWFWFTNI